MFPEKEGGLVVDYVGIASALKQAMLDYTNRDKKHFGDPDIGKTALVKFQEKQEICRDLLHGFDYSSWYEGSDPERSRLITAGVNFMLEVDKQERRKNFVIESQLLHNAQTLCKSLISDHDKLEVTFMDAVRVMLQRLDVKGTTISKHDINERISRLLEQSLQSQGVQVLTNIKFSLFQGAFMAEIKNMKERNLAQKILEGLIRDKIHNFERTNIVQSLKFSEMMNNALSNYLKGLLTNEEVIAELLRIAEEIKKCEEEGNELGLTVEEKAFYDALSSPEGVKEAYTSEEFVKLTKELTEQLRKNRTIDWNHKDSARAKMRVMVKRLLKKYHYPPEGQEQALNTVMAQCNKWADDETNLLPYSSNPNEKRQVVDRKKAIEVTFIPPGTILNDIQNDNDVCRLIHNMMGLDEGTTVMQIVVECQKEFQEKYFNMKGNDWRHLVRDYVREVTERPDLQETEVFRYSMAG